MKALGGDEGNRSKWAELAIEVVNSKGLCTLQENAKGFRKETGMNDHDSQRAGFESSGQRGISVEDDMGPKKGDDEEGAEEETKIVSAAEKAAMVLAAGAMIGESGAQPAQKANCAILESTAWSLAGRSHREGVGGTLSPICDQRVSVLFPYHTLMVSQFCMVFLERVGLQQ